MKLYTKTGDDGSTGLFGSGRVSKCDPRVSAYGSVDEMNAAIGVAIAGMVGDDFAPLRVIAVQLQSRSFDLGADLATPPGSEHEDKVRRIGDEDIAQLEGWIDEMEAANAPLTTFVLPGGHEAAARLHLARTVCRRAERDVIHLGESQEVGSAARIWLNRTSDLLFAMARRANGIAGVADVPWTSR